MWRAVRAAAAGCGLAARARSQPLLPSLCAPQPAAGGRGPAARGGSGGGGLGRQTRELCVRNWRCAVVCSCRAADGEARRRPGAARGLASPACRAPASTTCTCLLSRPAPPHPTPPAPHHTARTAQGVLPQPAVHRPPGRHHAFGGRHICHPVPGPGPEVRHLYRWGLAGPAPVLPIIALRGRQAWADEWVMVPRLAGPPPPRLRAPTARTPPCLPCQA